ncbi:MAG: DUF2834 domain-containing protein [Gemmatimonadota bacterium]
MKNAYLLLAVAGTVVPYVFFTRHFMSADPSLAAFVEQLFATNPAAGFTSDLLITSVAFWIWSYGEAKRHGMSRWWAYVMLNLAVGLSCALPLFLYVRERRSDSLP